MASVNMPSVMDVSSMNTIAELKNAVAKMAKELSWLLENLDWGNINRLHIRLNDGATVTIMNDGITINNGEVDTFKADKEGNVVMTSAVVQSKEGYPKVVMDPQSDLFGAYQSPTSSVRVEPRTNATSTPGVVWDNGISYFAAALNNNEMKFTGGNTSIVALSSLLRLVGNKIDLSVNDSITIPSWDMIKNTAGVSAASGFAARGRQTKLSQSFNCGIPIGAQIMLAGGGTATWTGVPQHDHTQD